MKINRSISFLLVCLTATQSIIPADVTSVAIKEQQPDVKQLDGYFTRLRRGLSCYLKRKPCKPEDQETVKTTSFLLFIALWLLVHRPWVKYPTDNERANLYQHIRKADVKAIKLEVTQLEQQRKTIPFQSLLLNTLRVLSVIQDEKRSLNTQLDTYNEKRASLAKTPQPQTRFTDMFIQNSATLKNRLDIVNQKEKALIEIAKYFIPNAGYISHAMIADKFINQATLEELGLPTE